MKGYKRRCLAVIMLICVLASGMTGCSQNAEDASAYVQADLDLIFQGEKEGAKQFIEASDKELEEMYENGITAFVENYLTGTDDSQQTLTESYAYLVKEIFRAMRYQVGEGKKKTEAYLRSKYSMNRSMYLRHLFRNCSRRQIGSNRLQKMESMREPMRRFSRR